MVVRPEDRPGEIWKDHPLYGEYIAVSNLGRVFNKRTQTLRKPSINDRGYYHLQINTVTGKVNKPVHLLVLETFKGERPEGAIARHLDDNKTNCSEENLEWSSPQRNIQDNLDNFKVRTQKLTVADVLEIRARDWAREEIDSFCQVKGIAYQAFYKAKTGRSFRHV